MTVPGFPSHYGLGIEMIIWFANIILAIIITIISFYKIHKTEN